MNIIQDRDPGDEDNGTPIPAIAPMTPEQMKTFVQAAQMGMACGLGHPWEWLQNVLHTAHIFPLDDQAQIVNDAVSAFVAFWNGCGSCPEDPCQTAGEDELFKEMDLWYKRATK